MRWTAKLLIKLIIIIPLASIQCKNEKARNESPELSNSINSLDTSIIKKPIFKAGDSLSAINTRVKDTIKIARNSLTEELLKKIKTVRVLTIVKENKRIASTGEDLGDKCDKWGLNKTTIEKIIKDSKSISGEEWHLLYDVWPCNIRGKILLNLDTFSYKVNAGSYIVIWNRDTSFYYGCTDKRYKNYFLSEPWDGKEEK